jgi:hypothetical protein
MGGTDGSEHLYGFPDFCVGGDLVFFTLIASSMARFALQIACSRVAAIPPRIRPGSVSIDHLQRAAPIVWTTLY